MDGFATIQPFGFDRVFQIVDTDAPEPQAAGEAGLVLPPEDLHEKVAELEARIERLHADHRAELTRARADGFDAAARAMLAEAGAVVLHAAQLLAGHAIDAAPARAVDEALGRALEQVAQGTAMVVRANPAMRGEIEALVAERRARAGRNLAVTVVDDAGVPEGDARIEWNAGGLNVDAEARRAAVMAELDGTLGAA